MSEANRGKVAEAKFRKQLLKLEASITTFTFERILDSHSAKGAMSAPRPGDFVVYYQGKNILLELKEVAHDFRLPKANFKRDQRARMMRRQFAGTICYVITYHSTIQRWRIMPLDFFGVEEKGSWDLTVFPSLDIEQLTERLL